MKNFINIADVPSEELRSIIEEAKKRKHNRKSLNKSAPDIDKPFEGKSMAMIFEKPSTRTRMSFYCCETTWRIFNYFKSRRNTLRQR